MENDFSQLKKDDLGNGLFLRQENGMFRFGLDSVLLADFAAQRIKNNSEVFDLCCGNGIVPLLLYSRNETLKITGVEIIKQSAMLAAYNVMENGLTDKIHIMHDDLRTLDPRLNQKLSYITVNPPYIPVGDGINNPNAALNGARHEVDASLNDVAVCASRLLKDKGQLFMVHRAHRTAEIISTFGKNRLTVKQLRFVFPKKDSEANLVLVAAMKNSGEFTKVLPPLIVYGDDREYTDEIYEIYRMMKQR